MSVATEDKARREGNPTVAKKYVYFFGGGKAEGTRDQRSLLGGKGANLAEMTNLGIPVPPGFTISTVTCKEFYALGGKWPNGLEEQILENMKRLEASTGKGFGSKENPLIPTGLEASIVIFSDFPVASASESVANVPAPVGEKVEPIGLSNITKYSPDGTINSYLPSASVVVEVRTTPSLSVKVTLIPTNLVSPAS